jgi:hypothetical protein
MYKYQKVYDLTISNAGKGTQIRNKNKLQTKALHTKLPLIIY